MVYLSTTEIANRLNILITGDEIRKSCTETRYKYSDTLFEIGGIPIISSENFKREVIEDKENKLYRLVIILSIKKDELFYDISSIQRWSIWDIENVNLNLEALDLYREILVDANMWNKIYNNPGLDWSDVYLKLLNKC